MADIQVLVPPGEPGWRVAVATAYFPDGAVKVVVRPLVGWAKVFDPQVGIMWLPAFWGDLGLSTESPQQIALPLGPGVQLSADVLTDLTRDAHEQYVCTVGVGR